MAEPSGCLFAIVEIIIAALDGAINKHPAASDKASIESDEASTKENIQHNIKEKLAEKSSYSGNAVPSQSNDGFGMRLFQLAGWSLIFTTFIDSICGLGIFAGWAAIGSTIVGLGLIVFFQFGLWSEKHFKASSVSNKASSDSLETPVEESVLCEFKEGVTEKNPTSIKGVATGPNDALGVRFLQLLMVFLIATSIIDLIYGLKIFPGWVQNLNIFGGLWFVMVLQRMLPND